VVTIMIVDDDATLREIISDFLSECGYGTVTAENGAKAVEIAETSDLLAIIMDIDMPVMNGREATRAIRALPGQRGCVPIFAHSGRSSSGTFQENLAAGMNGTLPKGNLCAIMDCLVGI